MKIDLKELGKRIKLIRKGQDLTQEMLAEKAGVSQHYIYEIEAGRNANRDRKDHLLSDRF